MVNGPTGDDKCRPAPPSDVRGRRRRPRPPKCKEAADVDLRDDPAGDATAARLSLLRRGGPEANSEQRDASRPLTAEHPPQNALKTVRRGQVVPDVKVVVPRLDEHGLTS